MLNKSYISKLMKGKKIKSVLSYIRRYGLTSFLSKLKRRIPFHLKNPIHTNKYIEKLFQQVISGRSGNSEVKLNIEIDIIIPVFNAYHYTKRCIESVLHNSSNCRLIIVNDKSTDERIMDYLVKLPDKTENNIKTHIIHNDTNLGFVRSVNKAYQHTKNHFVLLNSDAEVPAGWIHRLLRPILNDEQNIASVTPFSNSADLCSFPVFCQHQGLFKNLDLNTIDNYFRTYAQITPLEVPVGNGFCMAINKQVVNKIGLFNEDAFGRGYVEEYEWSGRANRMGYKNVIAPNLFVYHKHRASFGKGSQKQIDRNFKILRRTYPDLLNKLDKFIEDDPLKDIRTALSIIIEALTRSSKLLILIEKDKDDKLFNKLKEINKQNHLLRINKVKSDYLYIKYISTDSIYELYLDMDKQRILFKFLALLKPDFTIFYDIL